MIKKCVVCGKEFEAANYRYCLCSDECRKAREKQYHSGTGYKYIYKPVEVLCKICGKPVPPTYGGIHVSRKHYHEDCVYNDALDAVQEGAKESDPRVRRAVNFLGVGIKELREELL